MVSIIVPAYNVEEYLAASVNSVLAQTCADWELILVDDGSTDSTGSRCDTASLRSDKIKVIHKPNGGLSSARNAGLDAASGEYILFLDSDDLLSPIALETLLSIAINSNADIVCGDMEKFYDIGSLMSRTKGMNPSLLRSLKRTVRSFTPGEAIKEILYQKTIDNSATAKLFSRRLWENTRFREGIGYEDLDVFYRIFLKAKSISAVYTPIYFYRQHSGSYLHSFSLRRADVLDVTEKLSDYMRARHPELLEAALSRQVSANFNILGLIASQSTGTAEEGTEKERASEISERCWKKIEELRGRCLRNPSVRLKNKIAIMLSYIGGRRLIEALSPLLYK